MPTPVSRTAISIPSADRAARTVTFPPSTVVLDGIAHQVVSGWCADLRPKSRKAAGPAPDRLQCSRRPYAARSRHSSTTSATIGRMSERGCGRLDGTLVFDARQRQEVRDELAEAVYPLVGPRRGRTCMDRDRFPGCRSCRTSIMDFSAPSGARSSWTSVRVNRAFSSARRLHRGNVHSGDNASEQCRRRRRRSRSR